ncbi:MAG: sigma-54-dependent Fis family transcriptional regulator [Ectothiorhodospiraceae bacterium]|nr:sigma-54-dependent Fis family transcriptional regulator [Ectothiorhodospiraceae bacterium]
MRQSQREHIDEVLRTGEVGAHPLRRDVAIRDSWLRCMEQHKLDPTAMKAAYILPSERLREHRDRMDEFLHTARFGVETLYRQVAGMGYVLLLTDACGVTVDFIGDPTFDNALQKAGLYLGADWHEANAGTCGVGTCISTGEALVVHQTDHFDASHIPLTCTAAPVYDPLGELAAVLDISALKSPQPKSSQHLALQLVQIYAHRIENANLMQRFRREWLLKLSGAPEFADVEAEHVIALDPNGRIIGFNHRARRLLAEEAGISWREPTRLLGRSFEDFFDCPLDRLTSYTRSRPADQRAITLRRSRSLLFAHALPPQSPPVRAPDASDQAVLPPPLDQLTGGDEAMNHVLSRATRLRNSNVGILLQGETGTGKEFLAKAIHAASVRADKPFVAVNCAALPEALVESELFGYEAGTFTGARSRGKRGLILAADGGTLFLDEIGAMPLALQSRLLRVLSEREVLPLGSTHPVAVSARVVSASNEDLSELVRQGRFRDDLYYRLNGAVLTLPALRERDDLDWLIDRILSRCHAVTGRHAALSGAARAVLHQHDWPGNLRELGNALEFACAVCSDGRIEPPDLPEAVQYRRVVVTAAEAVSGTCDLGAQPRDLASALAANAWNVSATARALGLSRSTVHRRMRQAAIVPPNRRT